MTERRRSDAAQRPADLLAALLVEGLVVREVPGWRERRTKGPFDPVGVVLHHTVRPRCVDLIVGGRPGVPGPLANLLVSKDGFVDLVAGSRTHNAGWGSGCVLEEVRNGIKPTGDARDRSLCDDTMGNSWFYGIEVDNRGDPSDPYPDEQVVALVKACLAFRALHPEWQGFREIHHRQWTARKTDMSYRGDVPGMVAAGLRSAARR